MSGDPISLNTLYEKVGEVGAIARDAKHAANNASTKIDALALVVSTQGNIRDHVDRLEQGQREDRAELQELKADKLRREGAIGLVEWISRNYPLVFVVLGLSLWVSYANGLFE